MSQRVTVQYSIPIEDLSFEVDRLYEDALIQLSNICSNNDKLRSDTLSLSSAEQIDEFRIALAKVDTRLAEVNSLINGYVSYKSQESAPKPPPPIDQLENLSNIDVSALQSKLDNFKESFLNSEADNANTD